MEDIIIGMTSWPPRIENVVESWGSIRRQLKDGMPVRCVLALSREEFPGESIPADVRSYLDGNGIELLWDDGNRRSHKKLMPMLERWPDSTVLVVDDDNNYLDGWLEEMLREHDRWPRDIIYGQSTSLITMRGRNIREERRTANIGLRGHRTLLQKPANGAGGTLYPTHTFTRAGFLDRDRYMQLSPTSDETWQWAWASMEGRRFRCLDMEVVCNPNHASQEVALFRTNEHMYNDIHRRLADEYPDYLEAMALITGMDQVRLVGCTHESETAARLWAAYLHRPDRIYCTMALQEGKLNTIKTGVAAWQTPLAQGGVLYPPFVDKYDRVPVVRI